jgi:hypothetical protein
VNPYQITFLIAAFLVAVYMWARPDFVIRVRDGRCTFSGRLALAQQPALAEFLLQDLKIERPLRIYGRRIAGRLRLWFLGRLSPVQKQRIRNFLLTHR